MSFSADELLSRLELSGVEAPGRFWVAFSGGLDSTVLLHALSLRRGQLPAPLHAVHVNHGIHPDAVQWAEHCGEICERLGVPLESFGVLVDPSPGASLEAAARDARYTVFREVLETGDCLLTAQHQDDQLETFLLQALRGAGPQGLAAMPRRVPFAGGWLLRPMLDFPRQALAEWARAERLSWLDDPANTDERFDRNYLRHQVVPRLKQRWPGAAATISRAARHCAEAATLTDELAAADLAACGSDAVVDISLLRQLDAPRRRNLLRHWLEWQGFPRPSEKKLEHVLTDVMDAAPDAEPCVEWADVAVRRYRGKLYAEQQLAPPVGGEWQGGDFVLGQGWGILRREESDAPGLPEGRVEVRYRQGGERLRLLDGAHRRELKKLFQDAGFLPWRRNVVPLIYVDGELAAVADIWLNADIVRTPGWRVRWQDGPLLRESAT